MNELDELRRADPLDPVALPGVVDAGRTALLGSIRGESGVDVGAATITRTTAGAVVPIDDAVPSVVASEVRPSRRRMVGIAAATVAVLAVPIVLLVGRGGARDIDVVDRPGVELPSPDESGTSPDDRLDDGPGTESSDRDDGLFEPIPDAAPSSERAAERAPEGRPGPSGDAGGPEGPTDLGASGDAALTRTSDVPPSSGAPPSIDVGHDSDAASSGTVPEPPPASGGAGSGSSPGESGSSSATPSSGTTAGPEVTTPSTTPTTSQPTTPTTVAPPANTADQPVDLDRDLLVVTLDFANSDDGHAAVAVREVASDVGIDVDMVVGTPATDSSAPVRPYEDVMNAAWGGRWIDASIDRAEVVASTAERWIATIDGGGVVRVAEGGVSDFTADVVRDVRSQRPDLDTASSISVTHHNTRNENATTAGELDFLRSTVTYARIDDGNSSNATADLAESSSSFEAIARSGLHGDAWAAAFDGRDASRLDFSDTVTVLHVLGVGRDRVAGVDDFAAEFVS